LFCSFCWVTPWFNHTRSLLWSSYEVTNPGRNLSPIPLDDGSEDNGGSRRTFWMCIPLDNNRCITAGYPM
jgi:hypothetical protein